MRTRFILIFCGFSFATIFSSCKKDATSTMTISESISEHSLGAILDPVAYMNTPQIDFNAVKAQIAQNGYTIPRALTSSIILNHPPIGDQGNTGTCVSWSTGWALSGTLNNEFPLAGVSNPRSPWWVYQINHTATQDRKDDGMIVTAGLDIIKKNGVPTYALDSTLGVFYKFTPTTAQTTSAKKDNISSYSAIKNLTDLKTALSLHLPVEMGLNWYTSFDTAFAYHTTVTRIAGTLRGGHAVCIIGYDDSKNAVLIQNSWGTSGGDKSNPGCMWFDYGVLFSSKLGYQYYSAMR